MSAASCTSAARLSGLDAELGRIEPGSRADLVVGAGDPYDFPALASNVREVWQDGIRVV